MIEGLSTIRKDTADAHERPWTRKRTVRAPSVVSGRGYILSQSRTANATSFKNQPIFCIVVRGREGLNFGYWVTVHKTWNIYIRHRRVPLSEVYSSISESFHLAYTSGIEQSCVEVSASAWNS